MIARDAMYERYFAFKDHPFRLTPDPNYLFLGAKHREGFAHLLFAMREGSGFVAVTGEVGTGKTTLVRALLRETYGDVAVAYIFNPVLSATELLQTINAEFGLPSRSTSKKELIETLNNYLVAQKLDGGRAVVIVDEAQNLEPAVLEQLRLLSNLETETEKLLQIILLGQPELRDVLDRTELRQLSQRIALRWHLEPLNRDECARYIRHRLRIAGGDDELFDERALDLVYQQSGGIPRLVNILAHRSLLVGYTKGLASVGVNEVTMAAAELGQGRVPLQPIGEIPWFYKAAAGAAVTLAAAGVAFMLVAPLSDGNDAAQHSPSSMPSADTGAAVTAAGEIASAVIGGAAENSRNDAGTLAQQLADLDAYAAAMGSVSRLIEKWTGQGLSRAEMEAGSMDLETLGARRGLSYLSAEANAPLLEVVDLPAIVELRSAVEGETRFVLLEELDSANARIVLEDPTVLSRAAFQQLWTGAAHILWKDPEAFRRPLAPGQRGPSVSRLQALLRDIGVLTDQATGIYDTVTLTAVADFQASYGLEADGVAGTVTQIVLYNALARFARPTLARAPRAKGARGPARAS
jgi:general secretion pathway protein A